MSDSFHFPKREVGFWQVPNTRVFFGTHEKPSWIRRMLMRILGWKWEKA